MARDKVALTQPYFTVKVHTAHVLITVFKISTTTKSSVIKLNGQQRSEGQARDSGYTQWELWLRMKRGSFRLGNSQAWGLEASLKG